MPSCQTFIKVSVNQQKFIRHFCRRKAGVFLNKFFFIHCLRGDILTGLQLAFKVSVIPLNQVNKKLKNVHPVAIRNPGSSFRTRTHHFYFSGFRIKNGEKMFRITFLFLFFVFIEGNLTIVFLSLSTFASLDVPRKVAYIYHGKCIT